VLIVLSKSFFVKGKENLSNHLKEKEQEKVVKRSSEKQPAAKKRLSSQKFENPSKRRKRIQVKYIPSSFVAIIYLHDLTGNLGRI
jgi:hypothetical protein